MASFTDKISNEYDGDSLSEWYTYFKLSKTSVPDVLEDLGVDNLEDIAAVLEDSDLVKELTKGLTKVEFAKCKKAFMGTTALKKAAMRVGCKYSLMKHGCFFFICRYQNPFFSGAGSLSGGLCWGSTLECSCRHRILDE